jgi:hypothetical protein
MAIQINRPKRRHADRLQGAMPLLLVAQPLNHLLETADRIIAGGNLRPRQKLRAGCGAEGAYKLRPACFDGANQGCIGSRRHRIRRVR